MDDIQPIMMDYAALRTRGLAAAAALREVQARINALTNEGRMTCVRQIALWERTGEMPRPPAQQTSAPPARPAAPADDTRPVRSDDMDARIRPLRPRQPAANESIRPLDGPPPARPAAAPRPGEQTCPQCSAVNRSGEALCRNCAYPLVGEPQQRVSTEVIEEYDSPYADQTYFGPEMRLILHSKDRQHVSQVMPQRHDRDLLIGRSGEGSVPPDIDLTVFGGADLGVSRQHARITYDRNHNSIRVADVGSTNGTFINGQRLHPRELRMLRSGDELRFGRLTVQVVFAQPPR